MFDIVILVLRNMTAPPLSIFCTNWFRNIIDGTTNTFPTPNPGPKPNLNPIWNRYLLSKSGRRHANARNSGKIMVSQTLSTYIKLNSSCKCLHQHVSSAHTSQADIVINSPTHLRCYFWINFIIIYTYFTLFRYVSLYFLVSFRLMFFSINKHCQYELL